MQIGSARDIRRGTGLAWLLPAAFVLFAAAGAAASAERKAIRVLGDRDYPPVTYLESGSPRGFDVDVVTALGEVLGWNVSIELLPWDLAQKQVLEGQADFVTAMGVTEARRQVWDFATPTLTHAYQLFVTTGEMSVRGEADLAGKRVGVTAGGLPRGYFEKLPDVGIVIVANYEEGFDLLRKGALDAVAADAWVAGYVINRKRIEGVAAAGAPFARLDAAIAVPRGNEALLQEVNRGLKLLEERGTIAEIRARWEPKQVVYLLKEDIQAITVLAAGAAALVVFAGMAAWILTLRREIAMRQRMEEALRMRQARIESIFRGAPVGIGEVVGRTLAVANDRLCQMLGYAPEELIGQNSRLVYLSDDEWERVGRETYEQARESGIGAVETRWRRKDGRVIDVLVNITAIVPGNLDAGVTATVLDITDRKRSEQELVQHREHLEELVRERTAELEAANRELQAFSYTVSHDLRAPLRAIIGFSSILRTKASGADEQELLGRIAKNAQRLGQMVDDLLDFSRLGRGELAVQRFDPNPLVAEVIESARVAYPRAAVTAAWLPAMTGDRGLVRQVFENLVGNALKFSAKMEKPAVEVGVERVNGETVFFVRDNGAGFDMKYSDELFTVFKRLHPRDEFEGTGVGLATVHRIVTRHGGRVWAQSALQSGATFYFTLRA